MPTPKATCMYCAATWEPDFEREGVVWDGDGKPPPEDSDLLFAVCADCHPNVDTDDIVARLQELEPNAPDTIEIWRFPDSNQVKITSGLRRRIEQAFGTFGT